MSLEQFIQQNRNTRISFEQTMEVIAEYYHYQPILFTNGLGDNRLSNAAGTNEGSCKIFAFAKIHKLDQQQTLNLFGDFYWQDVMDNPEGNSHQNIRNFIKYGWPGIAFAGEALSAK